MNKMKTDKMTKIGTTKPSRGRANEWSRRQFLWAGAGGAAALGLAAAGARAGTTPRLERYGPGGLTGGLRGGGTQSLDPDLVLLLDRATFGFTLADYEYAESIGYEAYLDELLNTSHVFTPGAGFAPDSRLDPHLVNYTIQNYSAQELWDLYVNDNMSYIPLRQTSTIQLMWAVYGSAQLHFRMFEFWNHHFNIDINSDFYQSFILWPWLRDVILGEAMTTVPDMIRASAHGPAMLRYLNNDLNTAFASNENYARELLELHTLGADNGYTQFDIEQLAAILSGWTLCLGGGGCGGGIEFGDFRYVPGLHNSEDKVFLGVPIAGRTGQAGMAEGDEALTILVEHPNTAEYIAWKLCRYFLGGLGFNYDPPEDIVQMVKWTYLNSNPLGDIRSMLQIILHHDVLTHHAVPKFRRPFDLVAASLRATGANVTPTNPLFMYGENGLSFALESMGQLSNYWGPPNGPYDSQAWSAGGAFPRWTYLDRLARNMLNSTAPLSVSALLSGIGATAAGTQAEGLSLLLTGGMISDKEIEDLQGFIGFGSPSEATLKEAMWLAMSMPTYQFK